LIVGSVGAASKDGPVVTLSTEQTEFAASQEVLVTVTLSNPTKHSERVLKWFTPADGIEEPVFLVKRDGFNVLYTGAIYKRPPATGNDYITLKSGESLTYIVNLGEIYDLSVSGQYTVGYDARAYNLYTEKGNNAADPETLTSDVISLKIEGRQPKRPTTPPPPPPGGTTFSNCTTTQQTVLNQARTQATTYANEAKSYLASNTNTTRYVVWFGAYDPSRFSQVKSHFTSLADAWTNAGVNFDCKCKQNYYAYVYPDRPYNIYLCKVFWYAPLSGTDSQGGTLIHEMSHFYVVASTLDYVYGQSGAMNLAITNPANAVMNADNHEYFAENNPYNP
jgi:peptidyl-Lys metalloendopeptidase